MSKPKIVLWDLETLPDVRKHIRNLPEYNSDRYGLTLKADVNTILCFGYKLYNQGKVECKNVWDFKSGQKNINDDYELVKFAYNMLHDADAIVTHNGINFDLKFLNTRLSIHGLPPLPKITHIDTCSLSKNKLFLIKNRLNSLADALSTERKMENGGWSLWERLALSKWEGSKEQISRDKNTMSKYCKQDVVVLEKVFDKLKPYMSTLPNRNLFDGDGFDCPSCGSHKMQKRGEQKTKTTIYQRYQCQDCGSWSKEMKKGLVSL